MRDLRHPFRVKVDHDHRSAPARPGSQHKLSDQAGRPRPQVGIAVHAATGTRPVPGLAGVTAAVMQASHGLQADRARELTIAGTPAQVTSQRARYLEAGAPLAAVICDPVPSAESRELLAYVRCLLNQP